MLDPIRHTLEGFDTRGFCEVLGIGHADYVSNAAYLRDRGYVADSVLHQLTIEEGGIYITAEGIDYIEQEQQRMAQEATVNAGAEAIRDRMLGILLQHEETGNPSYLPSTAIAEQMELSDGDVRYHLDVLAQDSYIRIAKFFSSCSAKIDTQGMRRVREGYRHTPAVAVSGGPSIHITHSNVGLVNTGEIAEVRSIAMNISTLFQSGHEEIAEALTAMTEAVTNNKEITPEQQTYLLENLEELSTQAAHEPDQRAKPGVIKSLISGIAMTISTAGGLAEVWNTWGPVITAFFGIG
jgi:hypothetical protein